MSPTLTDLQISLLQQNRDTTLLTSVFQDEQGVTPLIRAHQGYDHSVLPLPTSVHLVLGGDTILLT